MNETVRVLTTGDEARLDAFLREHAASSLFLRSNLRLGGLVDRGEPFHGTYAAVIGERIRAVVGHFWNGNAIFQAPERSAELLRLAVATSGRPLKGLVGPWAQISPHVTAPTTVRSKEDLFELSASELRVPEALRRGEVTCRRASEAELDRLAEWRKDYRVALLNEVDSASLRAECRTQIGHSHALGHLFVLCAGDVPVSMCAFNARVPDCVQIGGVWTPVEQRNRGYARCVVAGAVLSAGVASVLFTGVTNAAAKAAYESLGYRRIGDYGIVLFAE